MALATLAVWPVGMPLAYTLMLVASRDAHQTGVPTRLSHATAFLAPSALWWEPLEMCRKLIVTGWVLVMCARPRGGRRGGGGGRAGVALRRARERARPGAACRAQRAGGRRRRLRRARGALRRRARQRRERARRGEQPAATLAGGAATRAPQGVVRERPRREGARAGAHRVDDGRARRGDHARPGRRDTGAAVRAPAGARRRRPGGG
eukprot:3462772-Prymnesium_polylepis.2